MSPSANSLHLHVHNQLSGSSLNNNTDNNSSASYSSTIDLHHKVNINLDNLERNKFVPRNNSPGMLQTLFRNLRKKSKYCFLMNSQGNQAFMRKVPHGAEANNILGTFKSVDDNVFSPLWHLHLNLLPFSVPHPV